MIQQNKGKISIHEGKKNGEELLWSDSICEKEYQYFGQATEALEAITWDQAEHICNKKLDASYALLFKSLRRNDSGKWEDAQERVLLFFAEEERAKHS